jgi:hypothetical protein
MRPSARVRQVAQAGRIPLLAILARANDQVSWGNGAAPAPTFCVPQSLGISCHRLTFEVGVDVAPAEGASGYETNDEDF